MTLAKLQERILLLPDGLDRWLLQVAKIVMLHGDCGVAEIAAEMNCSAVEAQWRIDQLVDAGFLGVTGDD